MTQRRYMVSVLGGGGNIANTVHRTLKSAMADIRGMAGIDFKRRTTWYKVGHPHAVPPIGGPSVWLREHWVMEVSPHAFADETIYLSIWE